MANGRNSVDLSIAEGAQALDDYRKLLGHCSPQGTSPTGVRYCCTFISEKDTMYCPFLDTSRKLDRSEIPPEVHSKRVFHCTYAPREQINR